MKNDYQSLIDSLFGSNYKHRTLRTVFDPYSAEWKETTIDEKISILKKILYSKKITLPDLILSYKTYYANDLAKKHVAKAVEDGLTFLLSNSI
ncbi:hypothetical protein [Nonlabens antarcticus]|uniref:hypothetical protein n=1 Tax=Nonlabens antarcticus TaxID=392714 RepID=UPI00189176AB|nr:hypothetical protein [Nonlabens antarcticus]